MEVVLFSGSRKRTMEAVVLPQDLLQVWPLHLCRFNSLLNIPKHLSILISVHADLEIQAFLTIFCEN